MVAQMVQKVESVEPAWCRTGYLDWGNGLFPAFLLVLLCLLTFVYHVRNYGCISDGYLDGLVSIFGSPIFHTLNIRNPASNLMPICGQVAPGKSKIIFIIKNQIGLTYVFFWSVAQIWIFFLWQSKISWSVKQFLLRQN